MFKIQVEDEGYRQLLLVLFFFANPNFSFNHKIISSLLRFPLVY